MKKVLFVLSVLFIAENSLYAGPSGCIVSEGKKRKLDPSCSCLETGKCYTGKEIKDIDKMLKDIDGQKWTGNKNKELLKKSIEVRNEILSLRARGLVRSREARGKFQELNKLNQELAELQKKDTERLSKKINDRKKRLGIKEKPKNPEYATKLKTFLEKPLSALAPKSLPTKPKKASTVAAVQQPLVNVAEEKEDEVVKPLKKRTSYRPNRSRVRGNGLSNYDKEWILKSLEQDKQNDPKEFLTKEDDSLFQRVSKAYLRNAYETLLSPSEVIGE